MILDGDPIPEEQIDRWARRVVRAGVGRPALFLVLTHLPLSNFALHASLILDPFIKAIFGIRAEKVQALLADRRALGLLAERIEFHLEAKEPTEVSHG